MQTLIAILCFVLGALLGFALGFAIGRSAIKPAPRAVADDEQPPEHVLKQWNNFLNYDGSERGQSDLED